ncbi:MAG: type II toxin-antitoxin system VapC family toxin [bacterium]
MMNISLIDTNVIVYALDKESQYHIKSKDIFENAMNGVIKAVIADKSLFELFAIITDEKRVNNPVSVSKATEIIELILDSSIGILYSSESSLTKTLEMSKKYKIKKQNIFDLVLIGIMLSNNIKQILTYNKKDFAQIKEIELIEF